MATITVMYKDKTYDLGYTRNTIRQLEAQGFIVDQVAEKPMTMIPLLFYGAFMKNHRGLKRDFVDEVFDNIQDKSQLLQSLLELYAECLNTLTEDKEGDDVGKATWEVRR